MKKNGGFTLIEVLIALMILALSLTAIVKATSRPLVPAEEELEA